MNNIIDKGFLNKADFKAREEMRALALLENSVTCQRIGKSIMGKDIELYTIGNGRGRVIYFGAHHALESITCNLLFAFLHMLSLGRLDAYAQDMPLLLKAYTYMVVPCVNPDGIDMRFLGVGNSPIRERQIKMAGGNFENWQANARGVDLNHNYFAGFAEYKKIERERGIVPGATLYSGEYPESEPCTRAAAGLVRTVKPVGIISLHSQGQQIICDTSRPASLRTAERLSRLTGYSITSASGTAKYGGLCDYTATLGIPSFTLEVGKGKNPLPESDIPAVFNTLAGALLRFPTTL